MNGPWHYLDVCRGRYLCELHGGFCDSSDNYQSECPLCRKLCNSSEDFKISCATWTRNPVDRGLQIMRNLQNRSARNAAIVGGISSTLTVVAVLSGDAGNLISSVADNLFFLFLVSCAIVALLISAGLFLFSMSHMAVIDEKSLWRSLLKAGNSM